MDWTNPLVFIIPGLAALSAIVYLARWMGTKDESINVIKESISAIRESTNDIKESISAIKESTNVIKESISAIRESTNDIKESISAIEGGLNAIKDGQSEMHADVKELLRRFPGAAAVGGTSPLGLTEIGESISEILDAKVWAEKTAPDIAPHFKGKPPYDVQEFCMDFVRRELNPTEDFVEKMKFCAYENTLPMSQVEDVLAVELRDAILTILAD